MSGGTHTYWRMTINNYDETDLALVQQGYPDYIRQLVYTLERGEEGTPHIQAYIRMNRDCRFSFMKKLFPRGNFGHLDSAEYRLNSQRYAQKLDSTAESPAVIINHSVPDPVRELCDVIRDALLSYAPTNDPSDWRRLSVAQIEPWTTMVENSRVVERPMLARFYVSPMYVRVWRAFASSLIVHVINQVEEERRGNLRIIVPTHTHTHSDELFSREGGITNGEDGSFEDGSSDSGTEESGQDDEGDQDSEGSGTETSDESDDYGRSQSDAESED